VSSSKYIGECSMIVIREEFKKLIPALTGEEFKQLEANILSEGIRDPLVLWKGYLVDGHNRYAIATEHGLEYKTVNKDFKDSNEVKEWMILNQFGRRNLSNYQRSVLALQLEEVFSAKAKENLKTSGENFGKGSVNSPKPIEKVDTRKELSKVASVGEQTIARVKVIEAKATPEVKAQLSTGELSINQAYQEIKKEEKKEIQVEKKKEYEQRIATVSVNEFKVNIFDTREKYRVIYADPPWQYDLEQTSPNLGGAIKHYNSMSIEELCALPIKDIADKDAVLFLWITSPKLNLFLQLMEAWGFEYKTSFVWDKVKHNMGHYNSVRHEFLLIGGRGKSTPDIKHLYDSVISIERSDKHSEKPVEFLNIIDNLYQHGNRIELFARQAKKENWYFWGNEV
jgi:N6-adenosine-specific RNA methylase IME4/ParB-like chromosome segregation protein Spo0J